MSLLSARFVWGIQDISIPQRRSGTVPTANLGTSHLVVAQTNPCSVAPCHPMPPHAAQHSTARHCTALHSTSSPWLHLCVSTEQCTGWEQGGTAIPDLNKPVWEAGEGRTCYMRAPGVGGGRFNSASQAFHSAIAVQQQPVIISHSNSQRFIIRAQRYCTLL